MKNITKKACERWHFIKRVKQRFGVTLRRADVDKIVGDIHKGRLEFHSRQSCRVTVWRSRLGGEPVKIFYDSIRHVPITAIPEAWDADRV